MSDDENVDLAAVQADDALIDAVSGELTDAGIDRLFDLANAAVDQALLAWRRDVRGDDDGEPLVDVDTALAVVARAVGSGGMVKRGATLPESLAVTARELGRQAVIAHRPGAGLSAAAAQCNLYLWRLHRAGYSFRAIAAPLGLNHTAVSGRVRRAVWVDGVPSVPGCADHHRPATGPVVVPLSGAQRMELVRLHRLASRVRGKTPQDHPNRVASERLAVLQDELHDAGHSYRELGDALGIRARSVRVRLESHGYRKRPPSRRRYQAAVG